MSFHSIMHQYRFAGYAAVACLACASVTALVRATAFAFVTSFGRFIGAGVNFLIGAGVHDYGSMGIPVATTAIAFLVGLLLLPLCLETRGEKLPF